MKEYYKDEYVTLYHADCREVLPQLEPVDLVLTDPPYGVSGEQNSKTRDSLKKNDYISFVDSVEYVKAVILPAFTSALLQTKRAIITPGNRCVTLYPIPDSFGCFYQPASVGLQPWGRADAQPILYYGKFPRSSMLIPGSKCSYVLTESPIVNGHPCPKPLNAWRMLITHGTLDGDTILDPFTGSGTTLVAAKEQGLKAIGIEICEAYCEIAARRVQATQVSMFAHPPDAGQAQEMGLFQ
jgi:DNA modification methylase